MHIIGISVRYIFKLTVLVVKKYIKLSEIVFTFLVVSYPTDL